MKDLGLEKFLTEHEQEIRDGVEVIMPQLKLLYLEGGIQAVVEYAYQYVDKLNEVSGLNAQTTCVKGCHFCCYGKIDMSSMEATYVVSYIHQMGIMINKAKSKRQNNVEFEKLAYRDKKCLMISKQGECMIYEARPMVCRIHNSVVEPERCEEKNGPINSIIARTAESFAMMTALHMLSNEIDGKETGGLSLHKLIYSNNL